MFILTAPIIAAVTAASKQRKKDENNSGCINNKDYLYKISFKLYLEFPPTKSIQRFMPNSLTKEESGIKSININVKTIAIPDKCLCYNQIFTVYDSEVKGGISSYVRNNYEGFTSPIIWRPIKEEMIDVYLDWVETEYGIILERKNIKFNEKFTWDIQFDEKEFEKQCRINDEIDRDIESMKRCHENRDPYFW